MQGIGEGEEEEDDWENCPFVYVDPSPVVPKRWPAKVHEFMTKKRIEQTHPKYNGQESWPLFVELFNRYAVQNGLDRCQWLLKIVLFMCFVDRALSQVRYKSPYLRPYNRQSYAKYLREIQAVFWSQNSVDQADMVFRAYKQETPTQPPSYYATNKFSLFVMQDIHQS